MADAKLVCETEDLRASLRRGEAPAGLLRVGEVCIPRAYVADKAGEPTLVRVPARFAGRAVTAAGPPGRTTGWAGPWVLDVLVRHPAGAAAPVYRDPAHLRLHFPRGYGGVNGGVSGGVSGGGGVAAGASTSASWQFLGKFQHANCKADGRPGGEALGAALAEVERAAAADGGRALLPLLRLALTFLTRPLASDAGLAANFQRVAARHADRLRTSRVFGGAGAVVGCEAAAAPPPRAEAGGGEEGGGEASPRCAKRPRATAASPSAPADEGVAPPRSTRPQLYCFGAEAFESAGGQRGAAGIPDEWLHPDLVAALRAAAAATADATAAADVAAGAAGAGADADGGAALLRAFVREESPGVYSFPCFTDALCDALLGESADYEASGLPVARPNSMNNYGLVLDSAGLEPLVAVLRRRLLQPLAAALFGGVGALLDGHHAFLVSYAAAEGADRGLDMHTDDSDVTFNVCLGPEGEAAGGDDGGGFTGGGLSFCGVHGSAGHRHFRHRYAHVRGRCVVHLGRQRHGADDLASGKRVNCIIWCHNSAYRRTAAHQRPPYVVEGGAPDAVCLSYTHDRDYEAYKPLPPAGQELREAGRLRPWCPPPFAKHGDRSILNALKSKDKS